MRARPARFAAVFLAALLAAALPAPARARPLLVPAGTQVTLRFAVPVDSATARSGQTIRFAVAEDVRIGRRLLFRRGAKARGVVETVDGPGAFGRSARVRLDFVKAWAVDGQGVRLTDVVITPNTIRETRDTSGAAGASAAGIIVLGPAGVAAGVLVRGGQVRVPAGALAIVTTRAAVRINAR
jgi:hypothetical protein